MLTLRFYTYNAFPQKSIDITTHYYSSFCKLERDVPCISSHVLLPAMATLGKPGSYQKKYQLLTKSSKVAIFEFPLGSQKLPTSDFAIIGSNQVCWELSKLATEHTAVISHNIITHPASQ